MNDTKQAGEAPQKDGFSSKLSEGRQRFLAHVIEHGLQIGRRTPEDFIRHFPPTAIMEGLRDRPQLRANILVIATGVKTRIALKKSAESAGEDLSIALSEGEADPETVVTLFDPDDRVRYLDSRTLWRYVTEGEFWNAQPTDRAAFDTAKTHIAYMLDRALADKLINHADIVDGITVGRLATLLPRPELEKIIAGALSCGREGKGFTESDLLEATPTLKLVEYIPLNDIWDSVIAQKIAVTHDFADTVAVETSDLMDDTDDRTVVTSVPDLNKIAGVPLGKVTPKKMKKSDIDADVDIAFELATGEAEDTQRGKLPDVPKPSKGGRGAKAADAK